MDDEFAKALDTLHNSIDQTVDHVALPAPVRESWAVPEVKPDLPKQASVTTFLLQIFFLLFAAAALQYVQTYVQRPVQAVNVPVPEKVEEPVPNLLQEDALTQAELDYLLKVKTAIHEPEPPTQIEKHVPTPEPENYKPETQKATPPIKTRPDHSFPIDEAVWIEPEPNA